MSVLRTDQSRFRVERLKALPLVYGPVRLDCAYKMDLVVQGEVIVEVKSVSKFERVHEAQILSYLKIANLPVGLLMNFNVRNLSRDGIKRRVNGFPE
jgi:GxxExxY protein